MIPHPQKFLGNGRFDCKSLPILYASPDLEICIHECRAASSDELYVATLSPARPLRLLDLTKILVEKDVTEFESLDMTVHMLFLASNHSYPLTRKLALLARKMNYDGLIYPSYFSLIKMGVMPLRTSYGISHRRFSETQEFEESLNIPNLAIFGRPIKNNVIKVKGINRLILNRVKYDYHFGPPD